MVYVLQHLLSKYSMRSSDSQFLLPIGKSIFLYFPLAKVKFLSYVDQTLCVVIVGMLSSILSEVLRVIQKINTSLCLKFFSIHLHYFDKVLCFSYRESLKVTLKDPFINNYYVRSQRGKSSVFTNFLASEYIYICKETIFYIVFTEIYDLIAKYQSIYSFLLGLLFFILIMNTCSFC